MLILSRFHLNDVNTPKDTTKATFIKYFNDKTVVLHNQVITGLLLLGTYGCNAGINFAGYHLPPELNPGPQIFSIKIPNPVDSFSVQNSGPRVEITKQNPHPRA